MKLKKPRGKEKEKSGKGGRKKEEIDMERQGRKKERKQGDKRRKGDKNQQMETIDGRVNKRKRR